MKTQGNIATIEYQEYPELAEYIRIVLYNRNTPEPELRVPEHGVNLALADMNLREFREWMNGGKGDIGW